ncbi:ankyrin repeat domain-containing protein 26 isoform 10-T12 [Anableps anableps]
MKKLLSFTKKKRYSSGTPDSVSTVSDSYDLKDKDLWKIHKAAFQGDLAKLKQLAKKNDINQLDKENRTALHIACATGHIEVVQFLVDSKAKLDLRDSQNRSALMKAVQGQHERCVSILLENDANPNLADINGNTALHLAANIPSISTAALLLQHGAEINAQNMEGFTPLTVAVREDRIEMAEYLLKETADVNSLDREQRSPLMLAASSGQHSMVKLLLQFDPDITLQDRKGWSADDYAVKNGHHSCCLLITEYGTKRTHRASVSHPDPSKKKQTLDIPCQDVEPGLSLGGPATDKGEHGTNEAGGAVEDSSLSESVSRASKNGNDEWPSTEDEEESVGKKPFKVNLSRIFGSKMGEGDNSAERGKRKNSVQNLNASNSQEEGSAGEDSGEEVEEEEDEEEEEEEEEDDDDEEEEEGEEEEEEGEEDESDEGEENEEEDGSEEEENDNCVADSEDIQNCSATDIRAEIQNTPYTKSNLNARTSVGVKHEIDDASEKAKMENADINSPTGATTHPMPATLDVAGDYIVSAIRVESKLSDEEESFAKECMRSSDPKINSNQSSTEVPIPSTTQSPGKVKEGESDRETENDGEDSLSDEKNSADKVWNDSDDDEENKTEGIGGSTLITCPGKLLANVGKNVESDVEDDASSNRKPFEEGKRRSSWGSSVEGSDVNIPKESEANSEILQQENDVQPLGMQLEETILPPKEEQQPDTSWDSSSQCILSKRVIDDPESFAKPGLPISPLVKNKPSVVTADESDWDSSEGDNQNDTGATCEVASLDLKAADDETKETHKCSLQEEEKDSIEKESDDPSPVVSVVLECEDTKDTILCDDGEPAASLSLKEEKSDSENEEGNSSSWDDEEESDKSEKRMTTLRSNINFPSMTPEDKSSTDEENAEKAKTDNIQTEDDIEEIPYSLIDGNYEAEDKTKAQGETLAVDENLSKDNESSEDSDSKHQKLQYDFASATVKPLDAGDDSAALCVHASGKSVDESEARLTSYAPLENKTASVSKTRESFDEDQRREAIFSSPPTKNVDTSGQHHSSEVSDEALPQTDIDDVDLSSPDRSENTNLRWHELKSIDEPDVQEQNSIEDHDDDGSEKEHEDDYGDSSDTDSESEDSEEVYDEAPSLHKREVDMFYIPSFLRGNGGSRMAEIEPRKSIGSPQGSQGEAGSYSNDNRGLQKKNESPPKRESLSILSKPKEDVNIMEELGVGEIDDLEDGSEWDSTSSISKRTQPGWKKPSSGLEEFQEDGNASGSEQKEYRVLPITSTPQKSSSSGKSLPSTPSKSAAQLQVRAKKVIFQTPDNEEGTADFSLMTEYTQGSLHFEEDQQKISCKTTTAAVEDQKSSVCWDGSEPAVENFGSEKPETNLTGLLNQAEGSHQEHLLVSAQSTNRDAVQQKPAVEGTLQLEMMVRWARPGGAPQTNMHVNGDPSSVFDDSSLSDISDDEERLTSPKEEKSKDQSFEEIGMAEDLDELSQSSDTGTDDMDSPTSGYRHASLLMQKLDSSTLDSTSIAKLQNIFHEYERSIQKARSRHGYLTEKVNQLETERTTLKSSLEEVKDAKSLLERIQLELQTEVTNLKFQLKQEQENRHNASMMYDTTRDKLRRMEEQHQSEVQERQKVELTLRNLELEMRTLMSNMKQLEEEQTETQRLLAQERSARALQENLFNTHLRKQKEMEEESKINISRSNETLSQLTEASDRERELLQQTASLQEQLSVLRADLEQLQANSSLKESELLEENETLKEQLEDVSQDLKLSNEAVTQTVFTCNNQLAALKAELAKMTSRLESERQAREAVEAEAESTRSRLAVAVKEAELRLESHAETEKALLREKEEHQRHKDRLTGELATQRDTISSLSQKLTKAEAHINSMENEVQRVTLQLTEKCLLLDVLLREKEQVAIRSKELENTLQAEKEQLSRREARQEAMEERLAQAQSEVMLLRQQLEEAQNIAASKERAITDSQERFSDILSKLRSDCEERVQLVEERNKELTSKAADLRDQVYKLEEEKNERETNLRQLQQELADSLKKLSMSEASLEVNTRYRNDLEEEKARLLKDNDRLRGKLEESEDQYIQAERHMNSLKIRLGEMEKELSSAAQKLQEALSASATSEITTKQLEEAVQKLEIDNASLEAATKQQSATIEALQKSTKEAALLAECSPGGGVRGHLEEMVSNLQSSKITLEDQLNKEAQKQTMLSNTAQDSQALWEEEVKSRSKLGLRLAELEKEKGELTTQMDVEKKKAKKMVEQKKAVDTRLDQEMKRNMELQKEMYRLRTLLKTAKKKMRDQEAGGTEFPSPMNALRVDPSRHSQADGAFGWMKDKVDDLQGQLEKETSRRNQLEKINEELKDQVTSLKDLSHSNDDLERSKRQLEEEVLELRSRMEAAQTDQSQVDQYRREAEEKARQEIQQKLEQVNLFLQSQAASQEALDQIKAANEANLRTQLEQRIRELEGELARARTSQLECLNQKESTRSELERYRQLYNEEMRLRKSLTAKLERANSRLSEANSKLLSERSRTLVTGNISNGSLVGASLDLSSLSSPANPETSLESLNRSCCLGFPLPNPVTDGQNRRVEDYLAKMQSELDKNISKELINATAELDAATARLSPVGSASRVELDPLSRATQQYLEVLKKNHRI